MVSLVVAALLAAADAGTPSLEPIAAPLGELVDVVTEVPPSGVPGSERVVVAKLPGCEKVQAFWLTRFVLGSAVAGRQVNDWFGKQPALKKALFGKADVLAQAVQRSRRTAPSVGQCSATGGWQLGAADLKGRKCEQPKDAVPTDHFFEEKGKVAQVVRLSAADDTAKDRCRPKLSAVLADDKGVPRLAVHADFGGVMTIEALGDKCEQVRFEFDTASQTFVPKRSKRAECAKR